RHTRFSRDWSSDVCSSDLGKIKYMRSLKVNEGMGRGDFTLGDSLSAGTYTIRAYTNWMRNFGEEYFFHREVELFRSDSEVKARPDRKSTRLNSSHVKISYA